MRLDKALVEAGLCDSRARAAQLIAAGAVTVDGVVVRKASADGRGVLALTHDPIPWVSRAALKLVHALDLFDLEPAGVAMDVGASTGGFTEVLLKRGAGQVYAVDVGHGQLHPRIAGDLRVVNLEGVNARALPDDLPPLDWIVSDVSFISLEKALPGPMSLAKDGAVLVALIKPQFEAGREHVGKGGVVKDTAVHDAVRARIAAFLRQEGWTVTHQDDSPITGADGNREFLIAARR
ncbi:23S rRNA (cytidine1920-2'-O)/16S rRNA (cytidine1409-2'-O)-methyltransferase [Rubricella aquisinus]|uniref:23S rRNA (Cytidine1920-2'-O)/16S rRNA (Cytidine1409-2'-O)-methyltransferase n=1 Tax=Rubricella aquisinus TaxID=2028108 RepID=A0A840WSM9_9RHOB|nr:TlyA family RNA methyltransferase [Rubricella aquisinus]MBB5516672.1 23S rRNA (cytidine1920-2'-O)/16S rRNA (cytidine1409-2'-O)-methyltransferase [Rubricella aquisinus]